MHYLVTHTALRPGDDVSTVVPPLPAWRRFNQRVRESGDVGIWHETYRVRAGEYEPIYGNMPGRAGRRGPARADRLDNRHGRAADRHALGRPVASALIAG